MSDKKELNLNMSVILVNPINEGNVGAIARSMANFDLENLIIVGSFEFGDVARSRAKHANYILDKVKFYSSLNDLRYDFDLLIGTTGIIGNDYNMPRSPLSVSEAINECKNVKGHIGLVFGPEDKGLSNDDLMICDFTTHIPASDTYSVLNLSHAATILFYEFFKITSNNDLRKTHKLASVRERDEAIKIIDNIINNMDFRAESDVDTQRVVWRRVIGKSFLTKRELFSVIGFFRNIKYYFKTDNKLVEKNKKK